MMAIVTYLTRVGMGKTEHLIGQLIAALNDEPFARVWVLLATARQETAFRQRLTEFDTQGRDIFFNVEFFNFYELYAHLLDMAGTPQRQIDEGVRAYLLRRVINGLQDDLTVFASIANKPGFVRRVGDFIYELKQSRVEPVAFEMAARSDKDRDLARIYTAYQQKLIDYHLADREGMGWLAVDALSGDARLAADVSLLLVDGFDQFTPVQADLLGLLVERVGTARLTMTRVAGREDTVGRRFRDALGRLEDAISAGLHAHELNVDVPQDSRHADLIYLTDKIFDARKQAKASTGAVTFIEAPDPAQEVGAILRQVKRLLLAGESPERIMIALRDWGRYSAHFSAYGRKYGLPLALHYGEPLTDNPAVIALMNALSLADGDFRRRDVIAVLRSPYWRFHGLSADDIDTVERISYEHNITGGRDVWRSAVLFDAPLEDGEPDGEPSKIDNAGRERLASALSAAFDRLTPPRQATIPAFIGWIEQLIGADIEDIDDEDDAPASPDDDVNMVRQVRAEGVPPALLTRDLAALSVVKRIFRAMLTGDDLMISLGAARYGEVVRWDDFHADLSRLIQAESINPRPNRFGQVLVTTATDARGLPHDHVFIAGLSEGLFPASIPQDSLYLDSERIALCERGIPLLTMAERRADDGLFYELISIPQKSLTLTRPTFDDGKPWLPSNLWREAAAVFSDADDLIARHRIPLAGVLPVAEAVTPDEVALAVAEGFRLGDFDGVAAAFAWLTATHPDFWRHIDASRIIEYGRYTGDVPLEYDGYIRDDALRATIAAKFGAAYRWSASQFNDYGYCGFRLFARKLLRLEALKEPEEGLDVLARGSLYHHILELTYRHLRDAGIAIMPDHIDFALETLTAVAEEAFTAQESTVGFRGGALWEQEKAAIRRDLARFVRDDFNGDLFGKARSFGVRHPHEQEHEFDINVDLGGAVGKIRLYGFIDRIDRTENGELIVLDYKSNSRTYKVEDMEDGRNVQMLVYLLALHGAAFGGFATIGNRKISGAVDLAEQEDRASFDSARAKIAEFVAAARRGDFGVAPSKPEGDACVRYCEFAKLCRFSIKGRG